MDGLDIEGIRVIELNKHLVNPVCMSFKLGENWLFCMSSFNGWWNFTTSSHILKTGYIGVLNDDGKKFLEYFLIGARHFPYNDTWRHL
jgi:hypothetical protein